MAEALQLESTLEHDGDSVVYFTISCANGAFSACVSTWVHAEEHLKFAAALEGFAGGTDDVVSYKFGGTGTCKLEVSCLDSLGHLGVWATFTEDSPVRGSGRSQAASLFLRCDPAAVDRFVSELRGFTSGSANVACLRG